MCLNVVILVNTLDTTIFQKAEVLKIVVGFSLTLHLAKVADVYNKIDRGRQYTLAQFKLVIVNNSLPHT